MRQGNRAVLSFRGHAGRCPPYRGAPYGRSLGKFPQIVAQAKDILEPFMDASAPIHERRLRLEIFALLLGTYRATIHADCLGYQWDTSGIPGTVGYQGRVKYQRARLCRFCPLFR